MSEKRSRAYVVSAVVALVLAVLTVFEYYSATHFPSLVLLMLLAVFKAVAVLYFYMHVSRLWISEEH